MLRIVRITAGSIVFLVALALSLPGVKVVRAETPAPPAASADAPMCREHGGLPAAIQVQRMRALIAAQARAEAGQPSDFVALSTTGHGYRGTNAVDLAPIEREIVQRDTR